VALAVGDRLLSAFTGADVLDDTGHVERLAAAVTPGNDATVGNMLYLSIRHDCAKFDFVTLIALDSAAFRGTHDFTIIRMHTFLEHFMRRRERLRLITVDRKNFVRPFAAIGLEIPFPSANAGMAPRNGEALLGLRELSTAIMSGRSRRSKTSASPCEYSP
jgi:hypothetical protein